MKPTIHIKFKREENCTCLEKLRREHHFTPENMAEFIMPGINLRTLLIPVHNNSVAGGRDSELIPAFCPFCGKETFSEH